MSLSLSEFSEISVAIFVALIAITLSLVGHPATFIDAAILVDHDAPAMPFSILELTHVDVWTKTLHPKGPTTSDFTHKEQLRLHGVRVSVHE